MLNSRKDYLSLKKNIIKGTFIYTLNSLPSLLIYGFLHKYQEQIYTYYNSPSCLGERQN